MGLCILSMKPAKRPEPGLIMIYLTSVVALLLFIYLFVVSGRAEMVRRQFAGLGSEKLLTCWK
jgi:hypothetical protein